MGTNDESPSENCMPSRAATTTKHPRRPWRSARIPIKRDKIRGGIQKHSTTTKAITERGKINPNNTYKTKTTSKQRKRKTRNARTRCKWEGKVPPTTASRLGLCLFHNRDARYEHDTISICIHNSPPRRHGPFREDFSVVDSGRSENHSSPATLRRCFFPPFCIPGTTCRERTKKKKCTQTRSASEHPHKRAMAYRHAIVCHCTRRCFHLRFRFFLSLAPFFFIAEGMGG